MRKRMFVCAALSCIAAAPSAQAQITITEIKIHADPQPLVRPHGSIVLQVRVYGEMPAGSEKETGRVARGGASVRTAKHNSGWLSKPFKYQGADSEKFLAEKKSAWEQIFASASKDFLVQDSVLYTAPAEPGNYEVEATLGDKSARLTIAVSSDAPARIAEAAQFEPRDHSGEPYRQLAERWAPVLAQETWFQPKSDYIARFDFDNDWRGDNNWDNLDTGSSQAFVHYAVMETATHWFLIYNVFHPRDYSDKCIAGSCHENDNEGLILTVLKDGTPTGRLQVMETLAHNNIYSLVGDSAIRRGVHNIDGRIEFSRDRPVVFIESGGHGIYGTQTAHSRYSVANDTFTSSTGVTYIYKGLAERPKHPNDRLVGYQLLPILTEWWPRACGAPEGQDRTFDEYSSYNPVNGRPSTSCVSLGKAFYGRKESSNKAKPFWGWHDNSTRKRGVLADGQWGLDPAYAVSTNLTFPAKTSFSRDYVYNPFLVIAPQVAGGEDRSPARSAEGGLSARPPQ
jgi:hypothetical protein